MRVEWGKVKMKYKYKNTKVNAKVLKFYKIFHNKMGNKMGRGWRLNKNKGLVRVALIWKKKLEMKTLDRKRNCNCNFCCV